MCAFQFKKKTEENREEEINNHTASLDLETECMCTTVVHVKKTF